MARERRRESSAHQERRDDVGFVLGVAGFAALAFTAGYFFGGGNNDCEDQLRVRDIELLLCEGGVSG